MASYPDAATIPLLTLQPLIENAILSWYSAFTGRRGYRCSHFNAKAARCKITVSNPCQVDQPVKESGNQLALDNIRRRMQAFTVLVRLDTHLSDGIFDAS